MTRRAVVVLTALIATGGSEGLGTGQSQAVRPSDGQSFSSATTAILVDVVVRDRKGRPVTDMNSAEFSLYEDGTPQKIDTFARVTRGGGIGVDVKWKRPASTVAHPPRWRPAAAVARSGRRSQPVDDCARVRSLVGGGAWTGPEGDPPVRTDVRRIRCTRRRVRHRFRDAHDAELHDRPGGDSTGRQPNHAGRQLGCRSEGRTAGRNHEAPPRAARRAAHYGCGDRYRRAPWRPTARGWGWRRPNFDSSRWNAP